MWILRLAKWTNGQSKSIHDLQTVLMFKSLVHFSVTFRWYLNYGENRPKVGLFYIENNFVFQNDLAKSDNRRSVKPTFRVLYASPHIILTRFTKHVLFCLKWFSPGSSIIDSEDSDYQLPPTPPTLSGMTPERPHSCGSSALILYIFAYLTILGLGSKVVRSKSTFWIKGVLYPFSWTLERFWRRSCASKLIRPRLRPPSSTGRPSTSSKTTTQGPLVIKLFPGHWRCRKRS